MLCESNHHDSGYFSYVSRLILVLPDSSYHVRK